MSYDIKKIIKIAKSEVGYFEKKSNGQLDSKTANAGSNNYTKYARDIDNLNIMNGKKQGYPWCAVFFVYLVYKAYGEKALNKILYGLYYAAGCEETVGYYKKANKFYSSPKVGDQIFFKNLKNIPYHTGIVYDVDDDYVYTIEGNTSSVSGVIDNGGCVAKKKYKKTESYICGYGRPNYGKQQSIITNSKTNIVKEWQLAAIKDGYKFPKYGADGEWGSECENVAKKAICKKLTIGYKNKNLTKIIQKKVGVSTDGLFGASTKNAVIKYQKSRKLSADGVVGINTWKKILDIK